MLARTALQQLNEALKQDEILGKLATYLEIHPEQHYLAFLKIALNHHTLRPFDSDKLREYAPHLLDVRQDEYQQIATTLARENTKIKGLAFTREDALRWQHHLKQLMPLQEMEKQVKQFFTDIEDDIFHLEDSDMQYLINMMRQDYIHDMVLNVEKEELTLPEVMFVRTVATSTFPKTLADQDCAHLFKKNIVNEMINLGNKKATLNFIAKKIHEFEKRPDFLLLPVEEQYQKIIDLKNHLIKDLAERQHPNHAEFEKCIHVAFGQFAHERFNELSIRIKEKNKDVYQLLLLKRSLNNKHYHAISKQLDPLYKKLDVLVQDKEGVIRTLKEYKSKIEAFERQFQHDDGTNKAAISAALKKILVERKKFIDTHQKTIKHYESLIISLHAAQKDIQQHANNPQWMKAKRKLDIKIDLFKEKLNDPATDKSKKLKLEEQIQLLKLEHEDVKQLKGIIEERKHEMELKVDKIRSLNSRRNVQDEDILKLRDNIDIISSLREGESITQLALADVKIEDMLLDFKKNNPLGVMQRVEIEKIVDALKRETTLKAKREKLDRFIHFAKHKENKSVLAKHHSKLIVGYIKQLLRIDSDSIKALENLKTEISRMEAANKLGTYSFFFHPKANKFGLSAQDKDEEGFSRH